MNQGKYVFAQLIEFLSHNDFISCVSKYKGNYKVKNFYLLASITLHGIWSIIQSGKFK